MSTTEPKLDSVVTSVINSFKQRAEFGQKKYGTNLDRTDLSVLEWIQHAQEEHMDAILYLEKLKQLHQPKVKESKDEVKQKEQPKKMDDDRADKSAPDNHMTHWGC